MPQLALPLMVASMAMTAAATIASMNAQRKAGEAARKQGEARQMASDHKASQMKILAGQNRAASQRKAGVERRIGRLVESQLISSAAASGAGALDPTVVTLQENIGARAEENALLALFTGEERARGLESGADVATFEGEQFRIAGQTAETLAKMKATATGLAGAGKIAGQGSSFMSKYGGSTDGFDGGYLGSSGGGPDDRGTGFY